MPIVVVEKLVDHNAGLSEQLLSAFGCIGLPVAFNEAKAIFIKPNLTYPHYREGVTTRQNFVAALVDSLRKINTTTKIYIGEGEGGYNSFSMTEAMRNMGFSKIAEAYTNVEIVNLSEVQTQAVELQAEGRPYYLQLPAIFFNEIDFSITCPVPKVHCMTAVTLATKNQWGCLPDTMRLKNHYVFDEIISQVCEKLKFRYAFLDGKYGLNQNGPIVGNPVEVNWFVASNSLGAFDKVVSEMMGFDWSKIGHLKMAARYGYMPKREDIQIIGHIDALKKEFKLRRNFWNYPALAAFHSRKLTYFFYFSTLSKPLHNFMYAFRKKPIA
jgi:uncharacterized protein (DUF362 family)